MKKNILEIYAKMSVKDALMKMGVKMRMGYALTIFVKKIISTPVFVMKLARKIVLVKNVIFSQVNAYHVQIKCGVNIVKNYVQDVMVMIG